MRAAQCVRGRIHVIVTTPGRTTTFAIPTTCFVAARVAVTVNAPAGTFNAPPRPIASVWVADALGSLPPCRTRRASRPPRRSSWRTRSPRRADPCSRRPARRRALPRRPDRSRTGPPTSARRAAPPACRGGRRGPERRRIRQESPRIELRGDTRVAAEREEACEVARNAGRWPPAGVVAGSSRGRQRVLAERVERSARADRDPGERRERERREVGAAILRARGGDGLEIVGELEGDRDERSGGRRFGGGPRGIPRGRRLARSGRRRERRRRR